MKVRYAAMAALVAVTIVGSACTTFVARPYYIQLMNPDRITVAAPDLTGVQVKLTNWIHEGLSKNWPTVCLSPPDEKYPIGETVVECRTTDELGTIWKKNTTVVVTPPTGDRIVEVDRGMDGSCAVYQQGSVRCWDAIVPIGGQLVLTELPIQIEGITTAVDVDVLDHHVCAVLADETIKCFGQAPLTSPDGNVPNSIAPVTLPGFTGVVELTDSCALINDGTVKCLYDGEGGTPYVPPGISTAVKVGSKCALLADGTVKCWGDNRYGQLGIGTITQGPSSPPVQVPGLTGVTSFGSTANHTCAVRGDATAVCWGAADYGQIGNGMVYFSQPSPDAVSGLTGVTSIVSGGTSACATLADGSAKCWGSSYAGSLGHGVYTAVGAVASPVPLVGVTNVAQITLDFLGGCVLLTDGTVRCWGVGSMGGSVVAVQQLPSEPTTRVQAAVIPVTVNGLN
ncbi:MAG TPA: hypothetical protein VJM33_03405 [Microthrixaceae bacterium]|nr:hypothetical protein [Microthrixaceae bacterium]